MSEDKVNINLGSKLLSIESIFKWKPVIYEENLNEISCEFEPHAKNEFNFNNFIIVLVQSYYRAAETDGIDSALDLLNQLDDEGKEYNDESDGGFFERIQNAYYHMIYASKIFLLIKKNKETKAMFDKIVPIDDMDNINKSAIYAMKAAVFALFSNEDTQKAFASMDKALKLDPDNPRWNFLKALSLRKIRKMTNPFDVPTLQEQILFKKAYDSDNKNVVYKLHLADVYREISPHASKRQEDCGHFLPKDASLAENLRSNIDEKIELAVQFYKEAADEYPDTPYVMFKCAEGLAKLYPKPNHIPQAKKLAKDGLKINPDSINGHLVMAFLCEYIDKDKIATKKHLKKCQMKRIFDAECNMIRFLHMTKPETFNAAEALETLLEKFKEKKRHAILYSQMVSYYMFVNLDLIKACDATIKHYGLNCDSTAMQVHRSLFIRYNVPFSLIDVLNDQVKFAMNGNISKEIKNKCEEYVQFINFQNIRIIQGPPQNFRQQILQGKPIVVNPKFTESPRRNTSNRDKSVNRRDTNGGRGDFKDRRNQSTNNHPGAFNNRPNNYNNQPGASNNRPNNFNNQPAASNNRSNNYNNQPGASNNRPNNYSNQPNTSNYPNRPNKPNNTDNRTNNQHPKKPPVDSNRLPSLMDNNVNKPVKKPEQPPPKPIEPPAPVERVIERHSEESEGEPKDPKDTQIDKIVSQMLKRHRENKNSDDSDESITSTLNRLVLGEKNTREKYRKNSGFDSDRRRPKDRRRDRSRRRRRSYSYSSDESDRVDRHHRRTHKRHSSTESDGHSRYRKGNKKDRYERDYSRSRRSHRERHHSSDYRDDSVSPGRRRHRNRHHSSDHRDSVSPDRHRHRNRHHSSDHRGSVSPDRHRHRNRHRDSRSPSYDKRSRRHSPKREKHSRRDRMDSPDRRDTKSYKRYDRDTTSHEKKYRRRSASREKASKAKNVKKAILKDKRDGNSSQELSDTE